MSRGHQGINRAISRRAFIAGTAGVAGAVAVGESKSPDVKKLQQIEQTELERLRLDAAAGERPDFTLIMRRPADQCLLTLSFWNISPVWSASPSTPSSFDVINSATPAYLTVELGLNYVAVNPDNDEATEFNSLAPQNILEGSYPIYAASLDKAHRTKTGKKWTPSQSLKDPNNKTEPSTHSLRPRSTEDKNPTASDHPAGVMAGQSWLAFVIPADMLGVDATTPLLMTTESLLSWTDLELSTVPVALPPLSTAAEIPSGLDRDDFRKPLPTETNIEMPYGLILSPPTFGAVLPNSALFKPTTVFLNQSDVVGSTPPNAGLEFNEVWHARMGAKYEVFHTAGDINTAADVRRAKAQQLANPHDVIGIYTQVIDDHTRSLMTARAVWCTDKSFQSDLAGNKNEPGPHTGDPSNTVTNPSLRYPDRYDIVHLTSDFTRTHASGSTTGGPVGRPNPNAAPFIPSPVTVDRLMLSSLGGWLHCDGHWDLGYQQKYKGHTSYNSSLLSWRHRASQGRDSYVRVVRKGYLFPWGHVASLITITEREVSEVKSGSTEYPAAFLRQKTFIVVSNPIKTYNDGHAPDGGMALPFSSIEALTLITPPIDTPTAYTSDSHNESNPELCFEPKLNSTTPFKFHLRGTDWAGAPVDFHTPVVWVDFTEAFGDTQGGSKDIIAKAQAKWNTSGANKARPSILLHNQRVSVAPPLDVTDPGPTQFVVSSFEVSAANPAAGTSIQTLINAGLPHFYPTMHQMTVGHPELTKAAGNTVSSTIFEYYAGYLAAPAGFKTGAAHKGSLFLVVPGTGNNKANPGTALKFSSDHSGGSMTPSLNIIGYSRAIGPVSGHPNTAPGKSMSKQLSDLNAGTFNPDAIFAASGASAAKLLGGIPLSAILKAADFSDDVDADNPETLSIINREIKSPHHIRTLIDWHPTILPGSANGASNIFVPLDEDGNEVSSAPDSMDLHAVIITSLDGTLPSSTSVICQIRNFDLNLFGNGSSYFIKIPVDTLSFRSQTGKKTDIQVQVNSDGVAFEGPHGFVQDLSDYLNFDGSGVTITTSGPAIVASLTLAIPNITLGILALDNIAFGASVNIPYNGDPVNFSFNFCTPDNPFQLEVLIFTGGGYVTLEIGPDGVIGLSIGFDFGFGYSLNLGIASGQVGLTGNISYTSTGTGTSQDVIFSAGITAGGGVSCLGIVSVSVSLDLTLSYDAGTLSGSADLEVSVHVIFFGFSIGIGFSETFAGSTAPGMAAPALGKSHARAIDGAQPNADPVGPATPPSATKPNTFGGNMNSNDWAKYCSSFVPIAA